MLYHGFILTNLEGKTDSWRLTIADEVRIGSLFELRRQVAFYQELGVLPPVKDYPAPPATAPKRKPGHAPKGRKKQLG
nr:hypothetical protein [Shewanella litorisediminis]